MAAEDGQVPQNVATAIAEVSERAQMLVREEIELAKAEITAKVKRGVRAGVIAVVAGVFVLAGLSLTLQGFAWLAWWALPVGATQFFFGFFAVALILFVLAALAGMLAARWFKSSTPPTPDLAIAEAQRIKETIEAHPVKPGGGS